jgi:hypothetical protein
MQPIHVIMIHAVVICDSIFRSERIRDLITYVGCIDGCDTAIDVPTDVSYGSITFGPPQPAVVFFKMKAVFDQVSQCCKPFS